VVTARKRPYGNGRVHLHTSRYYPAVDTAHVHGSHSGHVHRRVYGHVDGCVDDRTRPQPIHCLRHDGCVRGHLHGRVHGHAHNRVRGCVHSRYVARTRPWTLPINNRWPRNEALSVCHDTVVYTDLILAQNSFSVHHVFRVGAAYLLSSLSRRPGARVCVVGL